MEYRGPGGVILCQGHFCWAIYVKIVIQCSAPPTGIIIEKKAAVSYAKQ